MALDRVMALVERRIEWIADPAIEEDALRVSIGRQSTSTLRVRPTAEGSHVGPQEASLARANLTINDNRIMMTRTKLSQGQLNYLDG